MESDLRENYFVFRKVLHRKKNLELVYESVKSILGPCQLCKLIPGTAEDVDKTSDPVLLSDIPIELLSERFPGDDPTSKLSISIQNSFTRPYTLLQIKYQFRRGFLYDCIRVVQDCKLQVKSFINSKISYRIDSKLFHLVNLNNWR
jgi:hypothetical protein